jgi:FlaA1/EpsC-like NDP-sugar epimerase
MRGSTKFTSVRAGNVMGSNGSFIPYCIDLIKRNEIVPITSYKMSRYFMTLQEAVKLLLKASEMAIGGETFVVNMPACHIKDLVKVLQDFYGNGVYETREVGIRPGEKLSELLVSSYESPLTYKLDKDYYVILPTIDINNLREVYKSKNLKKVDFKEFSSETYLMDLEQIKQMLDKGGFLI